MLSKLQILLNGIVDPWDTGAANGCRLVETNDMMVAGATQGYAANVVQWLCSWIENRK